MRIHIDLDTDSTMDLTALTALVMSLGGHVAEQTLPDYYQLTPDSPKVPRTPEIERAMGLRPEMAAPYGGDDSDEQPAVMSAANADERDANGLPWDERIHASSRTRNADGSWRQRRNVPAETVTAVTAELSGAHPTPPAPPAPSDGPEAAAPTAPEPPVAPAAEPAAPPPPPVTAAALDDPNNPHAPFQALMKRVGAAGLVYTDLNDIAQQAGFAGYPDVAKGGAQAVATFTVMAEALGKLPAEG